MKGPAYEGFEYKYAPYSVIPTGKALTRLLNDDRARETIHGREYKCKRCDDWIPWDTEFFSTRNTKGRIIMAKTCKVCERLKSNN